MKKKTGGISAFRLLWYGIMGFLILGYIIMPFARTVLLALRTDEGMGLLNFREFFTNPNQRADGARPCYRDR